MLKDQLIKCLHSFGATPASDRYWSVICPFHDDHHPSCLVYIGDNPDFLGNFKCYGCGKTGNWNALAKALKIPFRLGKNYINKDPYVANVDGLINIDTTISLADMLRASHIVMTTIWPKTRNWRGFYGSFLASSGALLGVWEINGKKTGLSRRIPIIVFPVQVNCSCMGIIRGLLQKPTGKGSSYYTSPIPVKWVLNSGLFLYDNAVSMAKNINTNKVILVEGVRDALRLQRDGIPAIGNLGTQTYTLQKAYKLAEVFDTIIVVGDGDIAGREFNKIVFNISKKIIHTVPLRLPMGHGVDPGSMPDDYVDKLRDILY